MPNYMRGFAIAAEDAYKTYFEHMMDGHGEEPVKAGLQSMQHIAVSAAFWAYLHPMEMEMLKIEIGIDFEDDGMKNWMEHFDKMYRSGL